LSARGEVDVLTTTKKKKKKKKLARSCT